MNTQTATVTKTETPEADDPGEPASSEGEQPSEYSEQSNTLIDVIANSVSIDETAVNWLKEQVSKCVSHIAFSFPSINIVLVNDERMKKLHKRHKEDDSTTDVLTFDSQDEVEIVVCVDVAERNANALGHSTEQELLLYTLHGLLHCAGFDDHTDADFSTMHKEEDRILNAIGVGSTFQSNAKPCHGGKGDSSVRDTGDG